MPETNAGKAGCSDQWYFKGDLCTLERRPRGRYSVERKSREMPLPIDTRCGSLNSRYVKRFFRYRLFEAMRWRRQVECVNGAVCFFDYNHCGA